MAAETRSYLLTSGPIRRQRKELWLLAGFCNDAMSESSCWGNNACSSHSPLTSTPQAPRESLCESPAHRLPAARVSHLGSEFAPKRLLVATYPLLPGNRRAWLQTGTSPSSGRWKKRLYSALWALIPLLRAPTIVSVSSAGA